MFFCRGSVASHTHQDVNPKPLSFTNYFYEYPLFSPAIELTVKDPLPGTEIQSSISYGNNHFTPHDLPFQMCIGIVLVAIVAVLVHWFMRRQLFQPDFIIVMQPRFVVVYEDGGSYVHGIY